jgi:hypothetical protein
MSQYPSLSAVVQPANSMDQLESHIDQLAMLVDSLETTVQKFISIPSSVPIKGTSIGAAVQVRPPHFERLDMANDRLGALIGSAELLIQAINSKV